MLYDYDDCTVNLDCDGWILDQIDDMSEEEILQKIDITPQEAKEFGKDVVHSLIYDRLETEFERTYADIIADRLAWANYDDDRDTVHYIDFQ